MFEAAELGRSISKKEFKAREPQLHTELLEIQRALRDSGTPVIVIVSGVEGAGKGAVVNRLNTWFDARGVRTSAFWDESAEEKERPKFWRFWRELPPRGTVGIMFGSWYTQPIIDHVFKRTEASEFERQLTRIASFERMLTDDGALIVKFWFHLTKRTQRKRLKKDLAQHRKGFDTTILKKFSKHYDAFAVVSERAIRLTDGGPCPWHIIEAENRRYRDLTVGTTLRDAIRTRLHSRAPDSACSPQGDGADIDAAVTSVTILDRLSLESTLTAHDYRRELKAHQARLRELTWQARKKRRNVVAVFEGWDAAGKGGAIRRVTAAMDARLFRVISVAAPTDEEKAQHYLWRFWRHIPRAGYVTVYDRSWYGRVLVERVEDLAARHEWMRAYREINEFEEQLVEHGVVLLKFWLHMSKEEQLGRFEERGRVPWKRHKLTQEDWRNRDRWDEYKLAVNDMVKRTSTEYAPWSLVPSNDKRFARVAVVKTFCEQIERATSA